MVNISGYQVLGSIYESTKSLVYRGCRIEDEQPVILKLLRVEYPSLTELIRYRWEYEITRNLHLGGVVEAYGLEKYCTSLVMILEDFGGESLKVLTASRRFTLEEFLRLAIQITDVLGEVHAANVIHKDINPANIVLNLATGELKLIDFGIATVLSRENPTIKNPSILEGTLAYISPEQTGRMNRTLDYRTDFYSLGVTFYELLTYRLPFIVNDAMELVHCHIARQPISPHELSPEIPRVLSDIVMRLLAKNAEDRYQSACGIKVDLQECLQQLQRSSQILEFPLCRQDNSDKFQILQKLYGREREIETLLSAFSQVSQGEKVMMLIAGHSGIGKSALVQEIYRPITQQRGYFIAGKFDQLQRDIPYSALVRAFQSLVQQLLTESETQLNQWREALLNAFGVKGQVIVEVIPEVARIVGEQPPVQELGPIEARSRFNLVFRNFIQVFCKREHPLVVFLDDLQWSDSATLKLLETILIDSDIQYLFLIGAYRDNEVHSAHPLMMSLNQLQQQEAIIRQVNLSPLNLEQVTHLVSETLRKDRQSVRSLADLVLRKTEGNPFFVNEFLKTLYQENLLSYSFARATWQWNLTQIEVIGITDNVVELMISKLRKLPELTQCALRLAACLGNSFDLTTLSNIREKPIFEVSQELLPAVQQGLILPASELEIGGSDILNSQPVILEYNFVHDRMRQAACALIDEAQQKVIHLKIGRLLLKNSSEAMRGRKIFDLVSHLNLAQDLLTCKEERLDLVKLNLEAGRRAKSAVAYAAARQYLATGLEILTGNIWSEHYDLAFALHKEQAWAEYLNGNFERSEALINATLAQAKSAIEKAEIYELLIVQYTLIAKYEEAIQAGRKALTLLGIELLESDLTTILDAEFAEAVSNLGGRKIESLIVQPEMSIPEKQALLSLLTRLAAPAYISNQELFSVVTVKSVNLSLKYGPASESPLSYSNYGLLLGSVFGDYQSGYEFGLLALRLSERFNDPFQKCKACMVLGNALSHWLRHLRYNQTIFTDGYQAGLEAGDLQFSSYILSYKPLYLLSQGVNLSQILEELPSLLVFGNKSQNQFAIDALLACQLALRNLSGLTPEMQLFCSDGLSEEQYLKVCYSNQSFFALCSYQILKAQILYLYGDWSGSLDLLLEAQTRLAFIPGMISIAEHNFYYSLCLAALYLGGSEETQEKYGKQLANNQKQMKVWAEHCPENFLHKYWLVEAEIARLTGEPLKAIDWYDRAIAAAEEQGFIQNEALGNELAAKFWLERGKREIAKLYLRKARHGYQLWGAIRKIEQLEQQYPQLLTKASPKSRRLDSLVTSTSSTGSGVLDLAAVMKASQAIASEILLDELLTKLMKILIENAGAQKGYLILSDNGELNVEARGEVGTDEVAMLQSLPVRTSQTLPMTIINYVERTQSDVVLGNATGEGIFGMDPYISEHQLKSVLCVPIINQGKLMGLLYLENNLVTDAFTPDRLEVLKVLASQAAISIENAMLYRTLQQKVEERTVQLSQALEEIKALNDDLEMLLETTTAHSDMVEAELENKSRLIRKIFGRYLADEVVATLLETPEGLRLGGERRKITMLTSDLRGFTVLSERLPAEEVVKVLNFYLGYMADVITSYQGTIDEFMGDGMLIFFGAPTSRADDARRAVACAIAMQRVMAEVNHTLADWGLPQLAMGIGINTGEVVVGNIGSEKRAKYGVVGNQVNLAFRIESYTVDGQVLISESTLEEAGSVVTIRGQKRVQPKGVQKPITIYEVEGVGGQYNLFLPQEQENFLSVSEAMPLRYALLDDKHISEISREASLVMLSAKGALVRHNQGFGGSVPTPFSNIKLNLLALNPSEAVSEDLYAKVSDQPAQAGSFYIRFTAVPAELQVRLAAVYEALRKAAQERSETSNTDLTGR